MEVIHPPSVSINLIEDLLSKYFWWTLTGNYWVGGLYVIFLNSRIFRYKLTLGPFNVI